MMRWLRIPLTAIAALLIAFDLLMVYRVSSTGWPKHLSGTIDGGVAKIRVTPIPFTGSDWLILAVVIAVHAALFYVVWKSWHSTPVRA
jgi:hypothetical protein